MSEHLTLNVHGMTCGGCENAVKRAVSMIDGVSSVTASHKDHRVTVDYDPGKTDRARIAQAIENRGLRGGSGLTPARDKFPVASSQFKRPSGEFQHRPFELETDNWN